VRAGGPARTPSRRSRARWNKRVCATS
jgi:hypothetical protein